MDFIIDAVELQRVVKCMSVVAKSNSLDVTGRLLVEANENEIEFLANNGSTALYYTSTKNKITVPGTASFAYDKIKTFISSFKPWDGKAGTKEFRFVSDEKKTEVFVVNVYENGKSSKSKLRLTNFNTTLIHKPPKFNNITFTLNSTIFRAAINKVLYAINPSLDSSVGVLQGMNASFDKNNVYFAGSDGRVLSEYAVKNVSDCAENNIILQHDFITGLRRLLVDDVQMLWELTDKSAAVKFDDVVFVGRLITGHGYPEYKSAFTKFSNSINIAKEIITTPLMSLSDVLDAEDHNRITFEINENFIYLYNDQARVEIEYDNNNNITFAIDINARLLLQTLEAIKDDFVLIKFTDSDGVLVFDSGTFEDQKALITPLRRRVRVGRQDS
jgi:DNA polymerase III sliding clamp (beta) subunit (PCNA family)